MSRADNTESESPRKRIDPDSQPDPSAPFWGKTWTELSSDSPDSPSQYPRIFSAAGASVAAHVVAFIVFLLTPATTFHPHRALNFGIDLSKATPLYLPKSLELTQKEVTKEKAKQQLDIRSSLPPAPAAPRVFHPPTPAAPAKQAAPVIDNAPELSGVGAPQAPSTIVAGLPTLPKPVDSKSPLQRIPPADTKLPDNPIIRVPRATAEDALRAAIQPSGGSAGAISKGSAGDPGSLGGMQLMSDPQGVDFKPYLLQILNVVRRNWFGRLPDIARTGRPGQTIVQFIVDRNGGIPKLVIATPSGTNAYDLAAAGSVSASSPFPPLPPEFHGQEIRLQLAFSYNLPKAR